MLSKLTTLTVLCLDSWVSPFSFCSGMAGFFFWSLFKLDFWTFPCMHKYPNTWPSFKILNNVTFVITWLMGRCCATIFSASWLLYTLYYILCVYTYVFVNHRFILCPLDKGAIFQVGSCFSFFFLVEGIWHLYHWIIFVPVTRWFWRFICTKDTWDHRRHFSNLQKSRYWCTKQFSHWDSYVLLGPMNLRMFWSCLGGYDLLGRTKDQIRTIEQVNAARTACTALKLDGLVVIGGILDFPFSSGPFKVTHFFLILFCLTPYIWYDLKV